MIWGGQWFRSRSLYLVTVVLLGVVDSKPEALSVTPSTQWYGDDGKWSAISVRVGTPQQWVDLIPSTISSETWVVSPFGCSDSNSLCASERGGTFTSNKSTTWTSEGYYNLGLDTQLGMQGYGNYGLDNLEFGTTGVNLPNVIISTINDTAYWVPYFGLGIVPGSFGGTEPRSALSGLVEITGTIPSHSYGFTAGASYQQKTDPLSLTLGGYDSSRFVAHDISFTLNPSQQPQAYVNSISVVSTAASTNWATPVSLLNAGDSVSAIIDSSTPFLWLPQSVCDSFAENLGLSYNESLQLYTFDENPSQRDTLQKASLNFTFGLSNLASSTDIVNITLPYEAFDLEATFPFLNYTTYGASNSTKYYFPLKVATNEAQYTIGRAFLQEAYIITDYERNNFSVHQAIHTGDALGDTSLVSITRYDKSTLSGNPSSPSQRLSSGAVAGIAIGIVAICALGSFLIFWFWRRRHRATDNASEKSMRRSFLGRLRNRDRRSERSDSECHEFSGNSSFPTEVGADASHERFELPAPLGPAELESDSNTLSGTTENGSTLDSPNMSAYERHRRKIDRQQAMAVHQAVYSSDEKAEQDVSTVVHYRPRIASESGDTPLVSPLGPPSGSGGSLRSRSGQPSPVTPHASNWPIPPPPPIYKHGNTAEGVYAGPLPDNVQLPSNLPSVNGENNSNSNTTDHNVSTLGSHFTENENRSIPCDDLYSVSSPSESPSRSVFPPQSRRQTPPGSEPDNSNSNRAQQREADEMKFLQEDMVKMKKELKNNQGGERLLGEDLVHVPQPNEKRFSWQVEEGGGRKKEGEGSKGDGDGIPEEREEREGDEEAER